VKAPSVMPIRPRGLRTALFQNISVPLAGKVQYQVSTYDDVSCIELPVVLERNDVAEEKGSTIVGQLYRPHVSPTNYPRGEEAEYNEGRFSSKCGGPRRTDGIRTRANQDTWQTKVRMTKKAAS
jgi:hypothetical protein